jgi:hypothetical protein
MATLAVFLVLSGGTAVALSGSNTVFSDDIVDNEVYSADVRNDTLTGGGLGAVDLKPGSVGTSEVASNSLNGGDINESLLGKVPNADKLDGIDSTGFLGSGNVQKLIYEAAATEDPPITDIATVGPYTLKARCKDFSGPAFAGLELFANGPAGSVDFAYRRILNDGGSGSDVSNTIPIPADSFTAIFAGQAFEPDYERKFGTAMLKTGSVLVQLDLHAVTDADPAGYSCRVYGTATVGT